MPRLSGALVPLFIQNTAVVISAAFLAWIEAADNAPLPAWGLFTIVIFFSSVAVLASGLFSMTKKVLLSFNSRVYEKTGSPSYIKPFYNRLFLKCDSQLLNLILKAYCKLL